MSGNYLLIQSNQDIIRSKIHQQKYAKNTCHLAAQNFARIELYF